MFKSLRKQEGFTLIELMIVVAIIAILAAIAISQYQDYVIRSQVSEGSSLADGVKTAIGEFYNNYGRFDVTLDVPAGWLVGATGVLQNPAEVLPPAVRERLARVR